MQEDLEHVTYFAETDARNRRLKFGIKAKDRAKHMYVIGKTGMGKSTLLENLAVQDIQNGHGLAFIDPHGKTAELLLEYIPESRKKDVLYFAPFDMDYPVSFNVMEDVGPDKRHLVSNGLMSAFKKIWVDAWSARMEYILNNILLALLEYPDSTLLGVNRMLADEGYRNKVVSGVTDPAVKTFWTDEFAKYGPKYMQEAGAAIQNKIGQFISNPLVRNMIGQPKSTFDIRKFMDEGKIMIINLSKGRVGESNANLIGGMLITKIYLSAMSRADIHDRELQKLPNFYLFVDEFQNFANESFADILSEARKYKLNLIVAHQYIEQMTEEVRAAIFGNVGTMVTFRVGAYDAEFLEKEFSPDFVIEDLVNLGFAQIYLKLMIDGITSKPFSASTLPPLPLPEINFRDEIMAVSRKQFGRPRVDVENSIMAWHQEIFEIPSKRSVGVDRALEAVLGKPPADRSKVVPSNGNGHIPKTTSTPTPTHAPTLIPSNGSSNGALKSSQKQADALNRENDLRKAVSLSYLRQRSRNERKEDKKAPTKEHLSELRAALGSIVKDMIPSEESVKVDDVKKPETSVIREEVLKPEQKSETPKPIVEPKKNEETKELAEDVLRKILEVDQ